ncbi:MAG: hypothetical protein ACE5H7_07395 [Acidiferrobacterales bacterium]
MIPPPLITGLLVAFALILQPCHELFAATARPTRAYVAVGGLDKEYAPGPGSSGPAGCSFSCSRIPDAAERLAHSGTALAVDPVPPPDTPALAASRTDRPVLTWHPAWSPTKRYSSAGATPLYLRFKKLII